MNKKGLDEMQLQRKNKIGNQTFIILLYLLLIDAGIYGFGFRWLNYPANIIVILSVCSTIYLFRLIKGNAYIGPTPEREKPIRKAFLNVLVAVSIAMGIGVFLKNASFSNSAHIDGMAAPILFITSTVAIIIVVTISIIKKIQNRDDREC